MCPESAGITKWLTWPRRATPRLVRHTASSRSDFPLPASIRPRLSTASVYYSIASACSCRLKAAFPASFWSSATCRHVAVSWMRQHDTSQHNMLTTSVATVQIEH